MARRAYCASCAREVWLGRDGGCQFGHPASDLSSDYEADPGNPSSWKNLGPSSIQATPRPTTPAAQPAAVTLVAAAPQTAGYQAPMAAAAVASSAAAPVVPPAPSPPAVAPASPWDPVPVGYAPQGEAVAVPPPPWAAAAGTGPDPIAQMPAAAVAAVVGGAAVPPQAAYVAASADVPVTGGWEPEPYMAGALHEDFDYVSLKPDVTIGDTDVIGRRVAARMLDNLLLGIVALALIVPYIIMVFTSVRSGVTAAAMTPGVTPVAPRVPSPPYGLNYLLILINFAYVTIVPMIWGGRTIGKWAMGITVTDLQGNPPGLMKLVVREFLMLADGLLGGIVGLVTIIKNDRHQRFGDILAETVVVRTR